MVTNLPENSLLQGGKYRIIRFIGSGGFGCTYEGEHVMLEKRIAIKEFFVRDFCNREESTAKVTVGTQSKATLVSRLKLKFVDEAKALCRLQHPGIVRVSDVFEENGTAYYVMDYIEGQSLDEIVKNTGPLPESQAVKYIRQMCDALKYVHSHNRLHLDIKPANIMIDSGTDYAVLIDFGASKQYDEVGGENTSTLLGKTPGYAPPEQMANNVVKFTPATDIYAFGATFYKILMGITPPDASLLISGEPMRPLPSKVSRNIRDAIISAMQLNKKTRPQSIDEFLAILDNKVDTLPLHEQDERTQIVVHDCDATIVCEGKLSKEFTEGNREINLQSNTDLAKTTDASKLGDTAQVKKKGKPRGFFVGILVGVSVVILVGAYLIMCLLFGVSFTGLLYDYKYDRSNSISMSGRTGHETSDESVLKSSQQEQIVNLEAEADAADTFTGYENSHQWIDLGLSVKWATCNVGAETPEEYGNYYAWGETFPKDEYIEETSVTSGKDIGDISGNSLYDAARANWGGKWRLPTVEELRELKEKCTLDWITQGGHAGYRVTGPTGSSIFLPAAGYYYESSLRNDGDDGFYWCASPDSGDTDFAHNLYFKKNVTWNELSYYRFAGFSIRAVLE